MVNFRWRPPQFCGDAGMLGPLTFGVAGWSPGRDRRDSQPIDERSDEAGSPSDWDWKV
jgi:hypothetical protein